MITAETLMEKYIPASKREAIADIECNPEDGYFITLKEGWNAYGMEAYFCHTIHEDTVAELRKQISRIGRANDPEMLRKYWGQDPIPELTTKEEENDMTTANTQITGCTFKVGDTFTCCGLFGNSTDYEVISRTDTTITCQTTWTAEEDGATCHEEQTLTIAYDADGNERVQLWEYHGEIGWQTAGDDTFEEAIEWAKEQLPEETSTEAPEEEKQELTPAEFTLNGMVNCSNCPARSTCPHCDAYRRNPTTVGGLGLCPRLHTAKKATKKPEEATAEQDGPKVEEKPEDAKKATKKAEKTPKEKVSKEERKAAKAIKAGGIVVESSGISLLLTSRQVDFLREVSQTSFWDNGVDSTLWIEVLTEEIGGQFKGKPMTVGAMVSTLREKAVLQVGKGKVGNRTSKYFWLTETGKHVVSELGI